jgi:hypothetical protein
MDVKIDGKVMMVIGFIALIGGILIILVMGQFPSSTKSRSEVQSKCYQNQWASRWNCVLARTCNICQKWKSRTEG